MNSDLQYKIIKPEKSLSDFIDSFWCIQNLSDNDKKTIGLPDGRIDLFLFKSAKEPFQITLIGAETRHYEEGEIQAGSVIFAISFKFLAVEYILKETIADIVNNGKNLTPNFWDFSEDDLQDFDLFVAKATQKILSFLPNEIDKRKRKMFELIYETKGSITVKELSEKIYWKSRQINRYFNHQFGISLKAYCNIIRFRASLEHIANGQLFPEENFFDQNHFIKEVKKFSGVVPKELSKNQNNKFILLSAIKGK